MDVVGVSKARTSGSYVTKSGKKAYRGQRRHWYVYFYDDDGKFKKKVISALEVPYYGSLIRRTKSYVCSDCKSRFRAMRPKCPRCGGVGSKPDGARKRRKLGAFNSKTSGAGVSLDAWSYEGVFVVETDQTKAAPAPSS